MGRICHHFRAEPEASERREVWVIRRAGCLPLLQTGSRQRPWPLKTEERAEKREVTARADLIECPSRLQALQCPDPPGRGLLSFLVATIP